MIRDIEITAGPLYAGESWLITVTQDGGSPVVTSASTNPFYVRNIDDENCYTVSYKKQCADGTFGAEETFKTGNCGGEIPDDKCYNYTLTNPTNELSYYSFVGCNGSINMNVPLAASATVVVCAKSGTLAVLNGITYVKGGQCVIDPPPPQTRTIEWTFIHGNGGYGGIIGKNGAVIVQEVLFAKDKNGTFTALDGDTIQVNIVGNDDTAQIEIKDFAGTTIYINSAYGDNSYTFTVSQNVKIYTRLF